MVDTALTPKEQYKLDIITKVLRKELKPGVAAKLLDVSARQIRRLREGLREQGETAVVHKLKGKLGNHHINLTIKKDALTVIEQTYSDFKPTFTTEKLAENHAIHISRETTRRWMRDGGLWKSRR